MTFWIGDLLICWFSSFFGSFWKEKAALSFITGCESVRCLVFKVKLNTV